MPLKGQKEIYITRHGQTDLNKSGVAQGGGIDSSINDFGKKQAEAFYQAFKHVRFDKIYTSTLQRTVQSIQSFLDLDYEHEELKGLNEISWGDQEGRPFDYNGDNTYHHVISNWKKGNLDFSISGGESPIQVQKRQQEALNHILAKEDEKMVLICMHGRALRIFLCLLLNFDLRYMDIFEHTNLCLYKLTYNGNVFSVNMFNEQTHLEGLKSDN